MNSTTTGKLQETLMVMEGRKGREEGGEGCNFANGFNHWLSKTDWPSVKDFFLFATRKKDAQGRIHGKRFSS